MSPKDPSYDKSYFLTFRPSFNVPLQTVKKEQAKHVIEAKWWKRTTVGRIVFSSVASCGGCFPTRGLVLSTAKRQSDLSEERVGRLNGGVIE